MAVQLFDRDRVTGDGLLGAAVTDADGEARICYTLEQCADADEWIGGEYPELYVVVCDRAGQAVFSTESRVIPNSPRPEILVRVPRGIASAHFDLQVRSSA